MIGHAFKKDKAVFAAAAAAAAAAASDWLYGLVAAFGPVRSLDRCAADLCNERVAEYYDWHSKLVLNEL